MASLDHSNRIVFLLSLIAYLKLNGASSIKTLADHFQIDEETLKKEVIHLTTLGVPGEEGYYLPDDLFDIDWDRYEQYDEILLTLPQQVLGEIPKFSSAEALAIVAGLKKLAAIPEITSAEVSERLVAKILQASSSPVVDLAIESGAAEGHRLAIHQAMLSNKRIELSYSGADGSSSTRAVDPILLENSESVWYLKGWCYRANSVRTFRLDRISALKLTEISIDENNLKADLGGEFFTPNGNEIEVIVELAPAAEPIIQDYEPELLAPNRYKLLISNPHHLKRIVTANAGLITVLSPETVVDLVRGWAETAIAKYN